MMRQASPSARDPGTILRPAAMPGPAVRGPAGSTGRAKRHTVQVRASFRRLPRSAGAAGTALDSLS